MRTYSTILTKNGRIGANEDTYALYQRFLPDRYGAHAMEGTRKHKEWE